MYPYVILAGGQHNADDIGGPRNAEEESDPSMHGNHLDSAFLPSGIHSSLLLLCATQLTVYRKFKPFGCFIGVTTCGRAANVCCPIIWVLQGCLLTSHHRAIPWECLISTSSLLKVHVAYNTRYRVFICMLCHTSVPLKHLTSHLTSNTQGVLLDAPGYFPDVGIPHIWQREVVHNLSLPVAWRTFSMFVCVEMRKHGVIIGEPNEGKKRLPHSSQDSAVLGITVYSHGYICLGCQFAHVDLRRFRSCKDPGCSPISTPLQTFGRQSDLQYFPLPGHKLPSPPIAKDPPLGNASNNLADTAAFLRQQKDTLLAQLPEIEDGLQDDLRNIHPCFISLSIHKFLGGLNKGATTQIYSAMEEKYKKLSPRFLRLSLLSKVTFDADSDLCDPTKRTLASAMVAQQIVNFSAGCVHYRLRFVINTDSTTEQVPLSHLALTLCGHMYTLNLCYSVQ